MRRQSYLMRFKTLAFKPAAPDAKLEDALKQVLSFDVSGDLLATATGNVAVHIWSVHSRTCVRTLDTKGVKVAFSPDGGFLAATAMSSTTGHVCVYSLTTGMEQVFSTPHHRLRPTDNVCWSRDSTMLAITGETSRGGHVEQTVFVLSAGNGTLVRDFVTGDANHSAALAWSPHATNHLAVGASGFKIKIIDVSTGQSRCELVGCRAMVRSIAWSPHNDWQLAAGSSDGTVRVFDVTTGVLLRQMNGLRINVWCVAWSPTHPDLLATLDGSIRVFNVVTWDQRFEIPCASVSTSMTMEWLPGFQNTLISAEANGVRMFELRGLDRDGAMMSSAASMDDLSAGALLDMHVSNNVAPQPRRSSDHLISSTGFGEHQTDANEADDDAVVFDDESDVGGHSDDAGPPREVVVSHELGSREALDVDDSEEGTSFV